MSHSHPGLAIVAGLVVTFWLGVLTGVFGERAAYKKDIYDCTVKCPDLAHSFQVNQTYLCEVK